jgi:hypothetical protein
MAWIAGSSPAMKVAGGPISCVTKANEKGGPMDRPFLISGERA